MIPIPGLDIPKGLEELLPAFVAEMVGDKAILAQLDDADPARLAEHLHAMRGKCAMFGEDILFQLTSRAEERALAGDPAGARALYGLMAERVDQLVTLISCPDASSTARIDPRAAPGA